MQQLFLLNAPVLSRHLNLSHSHLFYSSHVYFGERTVHSYVPTLAREVLDNAPEINIKGVAVGDPCTDNKAQADSMDMVWGNIFKGEFWYSVVRSFNRGLCNLLHLVLECSP